MPPYSYKLSNNTHTTTFYNKFSSQATTKKTSTSIIPSTLLLYSKVDRFRLFQVFRFIWVQSYNIRFFKKKSKMIVGSITTLGYVYTTYVRTYVCIFKLSIIIIKSLNMHEVTMHAYWKKVSFLYALYITEKNSVLGFGKIIDILAFCIIIIHFFFWRPYVK